MISLSLSFFSKNQNFDGITVILLLKQSPFSPEIMGGCTSKPSSSSGRPNPFAPGNDYPQIDDFAPDHPGKSPLPTASAAKASPFFPFYTPSPARHRRNKSRDVGGGGGESKSLTSTPLRQLRRAFHPPSPAKHIRAALRRRKGKKEAALSAATQLTTEIPPREEEEELGLDKRFGFSKEFHSRVELGEEIGRGHFGYTCSAKFKKGERKGQLVAVKIISKSKVTKLEFSFLILMIAYSIGDSVS